MTYKSSTIKSKWKKTKWLLEQSDLKTFVPETHPFSKTNLSSMLASYSTVYFKPTNGSGGNRIIRIKRKKEGYETQYNTTKKIHKDQTGLYQELKKFSGSSSFLLQKGIKLAKSKGKPFDTRVMVQKTNEGHWVSTALFTKVGSPGKVATNYNQGGSIGFFGKTLEGAGYDEASVRRIEEELKQMGVKVGRNFDRHYKGFRELGLDVAVDTKGRPWILEVNTRPQFYPLKYLKDKTLYRRIVSYGKQYGRTK